MCRLRQSPYKLHPIVRMVVLCEKQNIALRSHHHDTTHLDTGENPGNVVLETYLATQHNNVLGVNTGQNCCHYWNRRCLKYERCTFIPSALMRHVTYQKRTVKLFLER